jgi:hypothetical protein
LERGAVMEGILERFEPPALARTFDGLDNSAVGLHREHQATAHNVPVDDDGTGSARAVFATDMRPSQAQFVAQEINQIESYLYTAGHWHSIDGQRDVERVIH